VIPVTARQLVLAQIITDLHAYPFVIKLLHRWRLADGCRWSAYIHPRVASKFSASVSLSRISTASWADGAKRVAPEHWYAI
jgi:hypothetical protein